MAESASERERRERAAIDGHIKAHKEYRERRGEQTTHEQLHKHVTEIAERVEREKGHNIYRDK